MRICHLNLILIQFQFDFFQNPPSCIPVIFILHPCTGTNDYRTFCKFMDKYQNFFILDGRIVLSDNLLNDRLCFSQVRFISNIYFQIQLSLRLSRCIRQTVVGQDAVWNKLTLNRNSGKHTRYYIDEFHLLLKEFAVCAESRKSYPYNVHRHH